MNSYLFEVLTNSIKLYENPETRKRERFLYDSYKIDSIEFIKRDYRIDFIWALDEIQFIREELKEINEDVELRLLKHARHIEENSVYQSVKDQLEKIPTIYPNYKEFPFFTTIRGLSIFFQQLFKILYDKAQTRVARQFVKTYPILITTFLSNPDNLIYVGREITEVDTEDKNKITPPRVTRENEKIYVIYPKYTKPNKIRIAIKDQIRTHKIKSFVDITKEVLTLELNPEIYKTYKAVKSAGISAKLTIPNTCNPHLLILLMDERLKGEINGIR